MTFAVVEETAVGPRLWQDALFDRRGCAAPTAQPRKQATDLSYTDATGTSVQHSAANADSPGPAQARFIKANRPGCRQQQHHGGHRRPQLRGRRP